MPDISITDPVVIIYENDERRLITRLHPSDDLKHSGYGLIICDLVRHIADAYKVDEDDVWEWVEKERYHHTTEITRPS